LMKINRMGKTAFSTKRTSSPCDKNRLII